MRSDYKFRRDVSFDFYDRVAKPVTEKIGEQIKKIGRTDREDNRQMQGLPSPGPRIHALPAPKKKPTRYIVDPDKGIGYQIYIK